MEVEKAMVTPALSARPFKILALPILQQIFKNIGGTFMRINGNGGPSFGGKLLEVILSVGGKGGGCLLNCICIALSVIAAGVGIYSLCSEVIHKMIL